MSELSDHLTKESVNNLYEKFVEGLDVLQGHNRKTLGFNKKLFQQAGEPLLRWLHYKLMETAQWDSKAPNATFPFKATRSMSDVVREETGETRHSQYTGLVGDASRLLKTSGLINVVRQTIWLRPWDGDVRLTYSTTSYKVDERVEKRIEEEADKPVSTRVDLRSFKVPDPNPEAVMEFVTKFVSAALKVQDQNTDLHRQLLELSNQVTELEEVVEESAQSKRWGSITDELSEMLQEN